jgi:hypothetical protein
MNALYTVASIPLWILKWGLIILVVWGVYHIIKKI